MTTTELPSVPTALHRGADDLPFVTLPDGSLAQLLQVDLAAGIWVVRIRFAAGITIETHKHTGHVYAFTQIGRWHYLEYPDAVNTAGSYLFEPAGSIHTLHVPEDNAGPTDVWFAVHGANLNLDSAGNVTSVVDAHTLLPAYRAMCAAEHGITDPPVVVVGEPA